MKLSNRLILKKQQGLPKIVKISANITDYHFANIINKNLEDCTFPEEAETPSVTPLFKKDNRTEIKNYRPVSILNVLSKLYEKYIYENLIGYANFFLSEFISAYRRKYGTSHVLMMLIEGWMESLDKKKYVGSVLMDLSKAFD